MRATYTDIESYLVGVVALLERHGIVLREPAQGDDLVIEEDDAGALSFELLGELPHGEELVVAQVEMRDEFRRIGPDLYERSRYAYELLDHARDYRRSFHLHSREWFEREFLVIVHEHCERPIGQVDCEHFEGAPIKDAYAGVGLLMDVWTGETPDCADLRCLS